MTITINPTLLWFDNNRSMAPGPTPNPGEQSHPHYDQRVSHLTELGAMSQLYAHEVNNLLTQVSARAQLALMRPHDAELAQHALLAVGQCCDRIDQLTQIFLTPVSSDPATAGKQRSPQPTQRASMQRIHAQVLDSIRESDRAQYGFDLSDQTQGYAPDLMPLLLEQVLTNLLLNAMRAIAEHPDQSVPHTIRIRAQLSQPATCSTWNTPAAETNTDGARSPRPATAQMLEIIVEDTGVGMDPSQVNAIMNGMSVQQPKSTPKNQFTRHGLGMRVCRKLLGTVGGTVGCESVPLEGTRMRITVPAIRAEEIRLRDAA